MGYMDEKLWNILETKAEEEDRLLQKERQIRYEYISAVKVICQDGINRAKTIRDSFPMFTVHDEVHICNVMRLMYDLLGEAANELTRDEAAMLILSACCHDIGMSYSEQEKVELFEDIDRLEEYLEHHNGAYVKAYALGMDMPQMTEGMVQDYLRCIHHERVEELLNEKGWPDVLQGKVDREHLISVCQSHGQDIVVLDNMEPTATIDLRFCAILLRLADILDFDTSRAPEAVYEYSGFRNTDDPNTIKSKEEWDKYLASYGFDFLHIKERSYLYPLEYHAKCKSMLVEQTVNCYLDWVDQELSNCGKQLSRFAGKWQQFVLPGKIKRNIMKDGYVSGQYRLTLDRDKIMELFVGKDLYNDPAVFVRELIQNAIDAVRTREQLDKNLPAGWKGQIRIRCWMDEEGYHWFRIEDNGIGMTEEIILNYFLKIGSSYYTSDAFYKSKMKCKADSDYMPISRFGIGILSCFMGDKETNRVEVSTKHFKEGDTHYPALRLSMQGINGYYYLASSGKKHKPGAMKGITEKEKEPYLAQPGTVVAVRTNLYQNSIYRGFKEIIDRYVIYPPVAIHYDGDEGSFDLPTEEEFMNAVHEVHPSERLEERGLLEFEIPDEELEKIYAERPEICFKEKPKLQLRCIALDDYTVMPYLKGAIVTVNVQGKHEAFKIKIGNIEAEVEVCVEAEIDDEMDKLCIRIGLEYDLQGEIEESINYSDVPEDELYDTAIYEIYNNLGSGWVYEICKLSELEWYDKYFRKIKNNTNRSEIAVHNGVLCGNADFFEWGDYDELRYATIVLLRDRYRPQLDVVRDGIHGLTLDMASELEIINRKIRIFGLGVYDSLFTIKGSKYLYMTMKEYDVLKERVDLTKQLIFETDLGLLSSGDLDVFLMDNRILFYQSWSVLSNWFKGIINCSLYDCLCIVFLREQYSLQMELMKERSRIYILKKEDNLSENYRMLFPAYLFLPTINKDNTFLTNRHAINRIACNEYHRLSQFIIKNGAKMSRYVPGIFTELLRKLVEESGERLIKNVNNLLEHLRNLPSGLFYVPEELFISEEDLC